jgi:hypothetical protein
MMASMRLRLGFRVGLRSKGAVAAALLAFAGACGSPQVKSNVATAECPVCKHEGDLACLCVAIEADTPHCQCGDTTYYFCSDECRAHFEAHPDRYLPKH